jgi:glycosyltransferase involved in cell wall biosynthesis
MPSCDHICICVCTFRRPIELQQLLGKLECLRTDNLFTYSIVIADNDRDRSAEATVVKFRGSSKIPVEYHCEPEQNIALARNKALQNARGEFVALIDDDEFPSEDWLLNLLEACRTYASDGVLGPVKPFFDREPPKWLLRGRFYERLAHPTGHVLEWWNCPTSNVLLKRAILLGDDGPFRREFGSGGEDLDFFRRMIERGHLFVWCNEAAIYEVIPPVRWGRGFMLRRALLRGQVSLAHPAGRGRKLVASLLAVPLYTVSLPLCYVLGEHVFMRYLIKDCDHLGRLLAACGIKTIKQKYILD